MSSGAESTSTERTSTESAPAAGATPLRVAVVGAGYFARLHLEAWARMLDVAVVGLVDLELARAEGLATEALGPRHGAVCGSDAAAVLARVDADVVDIVAPPVAHLELIRTALAARPRAIVCQKPFCADLDVARAATDLAEAAAIPLVVHENFRFQPWWRAMRDAMAQGLIGTPHQAAFRLRPGDGQGPDAYLARQPYFQKMTRFLVRETAVHWIDTFRFLMGEPTSVLADLRRLNPAIAGEDAGTILLRYDDGRRALIDADRHLDHAAADPRLTMGEALVEGTDGALTLDGFGALRLRRKGETRAREIGGDWRRDVFGGDCVFALQRHVVEHLRIGAPLENTARAYLRNREIEAAVYLSAERGAVVDLPR